jgi:hypothetical protein
MTYVRVLPRDLFNEADLLKCMGRLWIELDRLNGTRARIVEEDVSSFVIDQDDSDGSIYVSNVTFEVDGIAHRLRRPLNARCPHPLVDVGADDDFDPIRVFDDEGSLSDDFMAMIAE